MRRKLVPEPLGATSTTSTWDKAVADGWVPGETLFEIEEACQRGTIIEYLLSDAAQIEVWPKVKKHLTAGKTLYFSHGFAITYKERTGIVPPTDVDVVLVAPKGSGTSLRRMFLQGHTLSGALHAVSDNGVQGPGQSMNLRDNGFNVIVGQRKG